MRKGWRWIVHAILRAWLLMLVVAVWASTATAVGLFAALGLWETARGLRVVLAQRSKGLTVQRFKCRRFAVALLELGTLEERSMRVIFQFGLVMLLATGAGASAQDRVSFTVGTATAARGQKAFGAIQVPAGIDPSLTIPVAVVHGAKPGPVLAIVSGAHGTEYASIIAVERLIQQIDASAVSGTVILVPLVNVPSFEQKITHVNPVDGKSMNRFYPGRMDGTQTERASFLITKQVVEPADHLIDLHGGDLDENLRPYLVLDEDRQ